MSFHRHIVIFLFLCIACSTSLAKQVVPFNWKQRHSVKQEYIKLHRKFGKQVCRPGVEQKFEKLFKRYMGSGMHIPTLGKGTLDQTTIDKYVPELAKKSKWISKEYRGVKRTKSFRPALKKVSQIEQRMKRLLTYKRNFNVAYKKSSREKWQRRSRAEQQKLKRDYHLLLKLVPHLLPYNFPVNYLKLRSEYDKYKASSTSANNKRANDIYFYRKIVEDGAQNRQHKKSDRFLRTTIDTVYHALKPRQDFLSEKIRYDLEFVLGRIKKHLRGSKRYSLSRLNEWKKRTEKALYFYRHLNDKKTVNGKTVTIAGDLLNKKAHHLYELKKFVLDHEAKVFSFWAKKPELMRALFSLETILYSEVGLADPNGLERKDVAQVVINRHNIPFYSTIGIDDSLYFHLSDRDLKKMPHRPWLNTMLKEGEFSFTYFFIHGSLRLFCPDMTKVGRKLRNENVMISLSKLNQQDNNFDALRYFSRESMLGRIDMSSIWSNFNPVRERPGLFLKGQPKYRKAYRKGQFKYLYHFRAGDGRLYEVIRIFGRDRARSVALNKFFTHRNPHKFTYFSLR